MPTHLYCLLPAASSAAPPAGVRAICVGDLTAWVSDTDAPRVSRDARLAAREAVDHDRVIGSALSQEVTPVPASLADAYANDAELQADLLAHAASLQDALRTLTDFVEMTTIVAARETPLPATAPGRGRAYLEQLKGLSTRAAGYADSIEAALSRFGASQRRSSGGRVALSHLVRRPDAPVYREIATGLAADGFTLVVDGPRAPYSFARFAPRRGLTPIQGTILADSAVPHHD
jgi:hypothetical protein